MQPEANGRKCEHTDVHSYVADIQWQAKEVYDPWREAQEMAKRSGELVVYFV